MSFEGSYIQTINEISELLVWSEGCVGDVKTIEELSLIDFINYRQIFKSKYEGDADNKKKFIENTFEFARKAVEVICKTVAGAYGTKSNSSKLGGKNR
jgi:hypothetical protein